MLGIPADEILRISAKTGEGVPELLDAVVERIPAPEGDPDAPLQGLIFDSHFDQYRGVVSSVRVMNGTLTTGAKLRFVQAGATHDADEVGVRTPDPTPVAELGAGRGRLPHRRHQGRRRGPLGRDRHRRPPTRRRPSRATASPSPWCSAGSTRSTATSSRRCARRSRSCGSTTRSFTFEPETSGALGFGFRCGFLGLLHMEIIRERLEREFNLEPHRHRPVGRSTSRAQGQRRRGHRSTTRASCRPPTEIEDIEEPYLTDHDPHAHRLHRHADGAVPEPAGRDA